MKLIDIVTSPWAIVPEKLQEMRQIYETHMKGEKIDLNLFEAQLVDTALEGRGYIIQDGIAIIDIKGVLTKEAGFFDRLFFGTSSTNSIKIIFNNAINDEAADAVLLYVDSPGGNVDGTQELAKTIFENRGKKPIYAFTDGMMASAAYWIASAAGKLYISGDTTEVGSIGVVAVHTDSSEREKKDGISITEIVAGTYKGITSFHKPLSEEGQEYLQSQIDYIYSVFITDIAQFRGASEDQVLTDMADGRIFIGKQAMEAGLVDGVSTMEQLLTYMSENLYDLVYSKLGSSGEDAKIVSGDDTPNLEIKEGENMVSEKDIQEKSPEAYEAIRKGGYEDAQKEIDGKVESAKSDAAGTERARIKGIEDLTMEGHEDIASEAKFDGKTTPGEFAIRQANAQKALLEEKEKALESDKIDPVAQPEPKDTPKEKTGEDDERPVEEKAKEEWDNSKELRKEFLSNFDSYLAFMKNESKIRILRKGGIE